MFCYVMENTFLISFTYCLYVENVSPYHRSFNSFCFQFSDHSQRDPQSLLLENPTISPSLPPQHTPSLPLQKEKLPVNKRNLTGRKME
ncbi:hypothetical protein ERO13_D13G036101v2 [Gossypium hirsutum]|uniref:Uncharacterized protein isoform X2 n=1 Tax=Gossypium hirsutum TaxID=3635 RepID=A0ABM3BFY1_GOSHI|nr:uncharacterized protein LOC107942870 isoform X2 [Gossypium hirsutum]KAG4110226.1 hypothetical protein ERO13_D13G036101v2 [Gossypium hirsutum]